MARAKLNKGEIAGIRLIADLFVIRELKAKVFAKDEHLKDHLEGLDSALARACPKTFAAGDELQKQIKDVRKVWLEELSKD